MKKLAIFPLVDEIMPMIRYKHQVRDYELVYGICPKGWESFNDMNSNYADYICPEEQFYSEERILSLDAILLCKPMIQVDRSIYTRMCSIAEQYGTPIIYVPELRPLLTKSQQELWTCLEREKITPVSNNRLASIDVPVITILGFGENCEKWDTQLDLCDFFHQKGYKPTLISSNPMSRLMGHHTLPDTLDSTELTFSQQVSSVNAFVKNIEVQERPDLIILGVPGGIFKFNQKVSNGYGYLPFLVCSAVTPDISILSLYCGNYEESHLKELQSTCFYRFGAKVDYFHISTKVCDYSVETEQLNYYSVDPSFLSDNILRPQDNIFNTLDVSSRDMIFEKIMQELQSNIAVV